MDVERIKNGLASVVLDACDCAILARACREASGDSEFIAAGGDGNVLETLGCAFRGLAIACESTYRASPDAKQETVQALYAMKIDTLA